jgi:DNA-binding transcriptional regulator/RsmH inhibitor MraZ
MFLGTWKRSLDDKWRLPLPGELQEPGSGTEPARFYFAAERDHLILFSEQTFRQLSEQILAPNNLRRPELRRAFFGSTYPKVLDANGRLTIPEPLRERSGLSPKGEVSIVGTGTYAELWPTAKAPPEGEGMTDVIASLSDLIGE